MQLEIHGNSYGLQWGTRAFILAEKKLDMTLAQIMGYVDQDDVLLTLTYCAMTNWLQLKDETLELPFTYTEFCAWMDDKPQELGKEIVESYLSSNFQGKSMQARYDEFNARMNADATETDKKPVKKKKSQPLKSSVTQ